MGQDPLPLSLLQLSLIEVPLQADMTKKDRAPLPFCSQSSGEQASSISNPFQLQFEEAKYLVGTSNRLVTPFLHPVPTLRVETLPQV